MCPAVHNTLQVDLAMAAYLLPDATIWLDFCSVKPIPSTNASQASGVVMGRPCSSMVPVSNRCWSISIRACIKIIAASTPSAVQYAHTFIKNWPVSARQLKLKSQAIPSASVNKLSRLDAWMVATAVPGCPYAAVKTWPFLLRHWH